MSRLICVPRELSASRSKARSRQVGGGIVDASRQRRRRIVMEVELLTRRMCQDGGALATLPPKMEVASLTR